MTMMTKVESYIDYSECLHDNDDKKLKATYKYKELSEDLEEKDKDISIPFGQHCQWCGFGWC
jgi:putative methionine-R-sulfoxide reductase with GAF domain